MVRITGEPVSIPDLTAGRCEGVLLFKVDRQFFTEVVHYVRRGCRPLKEMVSVDLIVFDRSGFRIQVVMDDDVAISIHGKIFLEEQCYRIKNFVVQRHGKGVHSRFHIKIRRSTLVESAWELLPEHCFDLIAVSDFARGRACDLGIFDICGTLKTFYQTGMDDVDGIFGKQVFLILEDKELSSVWGNEGLSCCLHGECAEATLRAYAPIAEPEGVFVVIQYVRPTLSIDGGHPTITSYCDATKVFFDPMFPSVLRHREKMLGERYLPSSSYIEPDSPPSIE